MASILQSSARPFPAANPCSGSGGSFSCTTASCGAGIADAYAALLMSVPNEPPVVTIASPANGASYALGNSIAFSGSATDAEDGDLSANLSWTSNRDGPIGTGDSFSRTLSAGAHSITASVSDSNGQSGSASRTLTVVAPNSAPAINIGSPAEGTAYTQGQSISFSGSASDA